ncbi:peptidoglycan-binding protein [Streptomyces sp. NPDC048737]|uniref:peptidoglycan-binding protein n=1 Tax=unclassified Streptomyces TaxID=2593676 RepID=UPI00342149A1
MSLWTSLEPASVTVDPGSTAGVRLRVRNTGDVVDEYRFEPVGPTAPWTTVEPPTLRLYPGTTGTVELTFSPPRTPDATAGPNPYAVRVTPTEHPDAVTVPEGNLTVTPFSELRAELVPPTVKGRFRGRPRLAVDNLGNTPLTASVNGSDTGDHLSYDIRPGSVRIEPGRAVFVDATLRPRQIIWFGAKEQRPYALAVHRSGKSPVAVDGTFVQRGFLPRWLATALSISLALALTFLFLWIGHKPRVITGAVERTEKAAAVELPVLPSPQASAPAPKASEAALPDLAAEAGGGEDGGGSSAGGGAAAGEEPKEKDEQPSGPLPFRPGDGPNLFVQFAQVRMEKFRSEDPCRLTAPHTKGVMDAATVAALKCSQKKLDDVYDGVIVKTDGLGNLGRSTMTALVMAHFSTDVSGVQPGDDSPEIVWVNSALLWAGHDTYGDDVVAAQIQHLRANMQYLQSSQNRAHALADDSLRTRVLLYQQAMGLPATGTIDGATFALLHGGKVRSQDSPGKITADPYPPAPAADR